MEKMNVEEHLDEVLGIVEKPPKEIKKVDNVTPIINGHDEDTDFQYARENLYNLIERGQDGLEELIEIARVRFPKVRFEISDGVDLPFSDREFDRVLTFGTTVHDILFNDLLTSCYRVCSEYLLFDIRLSLNLQTLNQIEKAYVLDGAGKKYPYVVVSWNDFNNWLSTLSEAPTEVNIYGYWGEANKDTNLPAGYEKICMACVLIKKPPVKEVGKQKTKIQIDLPKEFSWINIKKAAKYVSFPVEFIN